MITNKDISIDSENGKITLNGNKYDLGTQGEIDTAVKGVYSVMGQMGAKNLIIYPYYDPSGKTNNGITYTYDKDGIITANGSTENNQSYIQLDDFSRGLVLPSNKKYTLTCEKTNDNNKGFAVVYFKNADGTAKTVNTHAVYEDGTTRNANSDYVSLLYNNVVHTSVTFWVDTDSIYITQARIHTNSGTITNAVLKPMIRLASDTDNTYQPYAKTNKQLTDQLATKQDTLTFDDVPTENSTNPVKSGGVFSSIFNISGGGKTIIPANADMNTLEFTAVGEYITNGNNKAILNVPSAITNLSFYMKVINTLTNEITQIDSAWKERVQIIIPIDVANIYIREVKSGSSLSDITYGSWKKITPTAV